MRRSVPFAVLGLLASLALPARADYPPQDCASALVMAAEGQSAGCNTIGKTLNLDQYDRKVVTVYVQTGQVDALLGCGGTDSSGPQYRTFRVTAPYSGADSVPLTSYCWVTITATTAGTTAVVTLTSGQTID